MKERYRLGLIIIAIAFTLDVLTILVFSKPHGISSLNALLVLGVYALGLYILAKVKGYPGIFAGLCMLRIIGAFLILVLPDKNTSK